MLIEDERRNAEQYKDQVGVCHTCTESRLVIWASFVYPRSDRSPREENHWNN